MPPAPTARLRLREMTADDLEAMAALLGDPEVMTYYPRPKTRDEAARWIDWNLTNYAEHGYGLWIVETVDGEFIGDCGLTRQRVNGRGVLEVGFHTRTALQRRGYASEAAAACRDFAREHTDERVLTAIIHPDNAASKAVAAKIGMTHTEDDLAAGIPLRHVFSMRLR